MSSYQSYTEEDTFAAIQQILPEIQSQLKEQLLEEEQLKIKESLQIQLQEVQRQAQEQYLIALEELEEESKRLKQEQTNQLKQKIDRTVSENEDKLRKHLTELQEKFIKDNFNEGVLKHPKILQIQEILMEEICISYQEKFQITKNRKVKEMIMKLETRQQKERKERDKIIKNKVYLSGGLEDLKRDIEILKVGVASMKSEYNIKIKKIDEQIKATKQKNKSLESQENLEELREKYERLREEKDLECEKIMRKQEEQESKPASYLCSFSLNRDSACHEAEDVVPEESQQYEYEYESSEEELEKQIYPNPPTYYVQSLEPPPQQKNPILNLDIAALLREEWEDDPLKKYFTNSTKENNSQLSNPNSRKPSNFQQHYHEQLKKMNNRQKLSLQSRKKIISNLASRNKLYL